MRFFKRAKKTDGWMAMVMQRDGIAVACVARATGAKPEVRAVGFVGGQDGAQLLDKVAREYPHATSACTMVLGTGEYQFISVEAPNVPREELKTAIFATGAGTYQNYTECMFMMPGIGQFRPGDNSNAFIGTKGQLEEVSEVRCEMVCQTKEITERAAEALKK